MDNSYVEIKIKVNIDNLENIENIFYKLGRFELYVEDPRILCGNWFSHISLTQYSKFCHGKKREKVRALGVGSFRAGSKKGETGLPSACKFTKGVGLTVFGPE